jgi:hypothetical protein
VVQLVGEDEELKRVLGEEESGLEHHGQLGDPDRTRSASNESNHDRLIGPAKKDDFLGITAKNADQKRFSPNFVVWAPAPRGNRPQFEKKLIILIANIVILQHFDDFREKL